MAFSKYANAAIVKPDINFAGWANVRRASKDATTPFDIRRGAKIVLQEYEPKDFLLSHCTIIASVDSEKSNAPLGKHVVDGFQIERKYADWLITPETSKYVNNNNDGWERKLLMACFRTFIGGENYVEHIQIPEMSKGKIIDAAARDIGDSIYVDILVATQRRHRSLISAITSGQLQTLSMGCFVSGTPVTMADGTRLPIEEVAVGDFVLTHKGRPREVQNKQLHYGKWNMRRVSVVGVPDAIEATDNHPFYVLRPAKVCACGCGEALIVKDSDPTRRMAKRFKPGHDKRVLNPNGAYSLDEARLRRENLDDIKSFKVEKVRADELAVGDYAIFPKLNAEVVQHDPGIGKARLLGYFLAEGSFLKAKGVPSEVQFNFSFAEKATFVAEVVGLLRDEFPGCKPWVQDREDRNTSTVHVAGKRVASWFKTHGGEYSHLKRMSLDVMQWSPKSQRHLLGAWINGDGQRNVSGHSVGTTTSYALATQLHVLAIRCGLPVRMDCIFGGKSVVIAEAVVGGVSRRHEETHKLAAFNLYFPQSYAKDLADVTSKAPVEGARKKERHLRVMDDMVIFPITSIEYFAYQGWVHNMEVDEDHSYQVGGVAVSNCQVEFTCCTKCGNVAYDETQLCNHIRYFKGNDYVDELGKKRKIAELCFPPGTRVLDGAGKPRPIDDLQVGDMVLSHTGKRREVTRTFERDFQGDLTTLKVVGLPHTTLKSTPQHPYYVLAPRDTCACGCGGKLTTRKTFSRAEYTRTYVVGHNPNNKVSNLRPQDFAFKEAADIQVGDMLALPIPTEVITPVDVNESRATLLGWFLAEGSYHKVQGERVGVEFTLNDTDEMPVAEELACLLGVEFPKDDSERYAEPRIYRTKRAEDGYKLVVRYVHRDAAAWFFHHAGEYAGEKQLSEDAIFWPLPLQRKVLHAYVLGDGQSDSLARHSVCSVSDILITQMQVLAARCGFWTRRQIIFDDKSVELAQVVGGKMAPVDTRGFRPRHELHFQPSDDTSTFFGFVKSGEHVRHLAPVWREQDGYMLYRVREVGVEAYSGPVYNISVAEDESYLVEGIATHNCGHINEEPGSVKFIEASWVANPAFTGAVLRNVLSPEELAEIRQVGEKMQIAFSEPARVASPNHMQRAARLLSAEQGQGQGDDASAPPKEEKPEGKEDPLGKAVDEMADLIREKAIAKARSQMGEMENPRLPDENQSNESLIKSALQDPTWRRIAKIVLENTPKDSVAKKMLLGMVFYRHGGWKAVGDSRKFSGREVLGLSRLIDLATKRRIMAGETRIYRAVLAVGGLGKDQDVNGYLTACRQIVGRTLTDSERHAFLIKGRLYALGS